MLRLISRAVAPKNAFVRPVAVRAFAAHSPWGSDTWRHDKNAFAYWCKDAVKDSTDSQRELYGFLAVAFGDVDANKDGLINAKEFDLLCEKVASLPRRFGFAPSWEKEYGGDRQKRAAARKAMFDAIDTRNGPARGSLGLKQFCRWAKDHIVGKVATLDMKSKVDFAHVEDYDEVTFINYLEHAVNNPTSGAYASLYNFLLTLFVEADLKCKGTINRSEFDLIVDRAAQVPRQFGLAPAGSSKELRDKIFNSMDDNNSGTITFRKFVLWTVTHAQGKIKDHRAGKGYKK